MNNSPFVLFSCVFGGLKQAVSYLAYEAPIVYDTPMSSKCLNCFRSVKTCLCNEIKQVDPGVKFVILMHPHEAYKRKNGTGRLTSLSLENSEIIVDISFNINRRTRELIEDPQYYPMVLYPGEEAHGAETFDFKSFAKDSTLLVFLLDATWDLARKMMHQSPILQKLPKLSFYREYRSRYRFKKQPADYCLSTLESAYYLIKELQKSGICDPQVSIEGMVNVFEKMVQYQLSHENHKHLA